jgi:heat shock protein 4
VEKAATIQKWLEDQIVRQSERPKNVDPVLTSAEILKRKDEVIYFCHPLLAKPKPKVAVPNSGTETPKSGRETPNPPAQESKKEKSNPPAQEPKKEEPEGPSEMDVD